MKIEMTRTQLCSLIMACTAADVQSSEGTKKWKCLHDELKSVLGAYDIDCDNNDTSVNRKIYKCGEEE